MSFHLSSLHACRRMGKMTAISLTLTALCGIALAEPPPEPTRSDLALASTPVASTAMHEIFAMDRQTARIKSAGELADYMATADSEPDNPFRALSTESRRVFLDSLQFGNGGLASFNEAVLERELTPAQSYAILKLFGMQTAILTMNYPQVKSRVAGNGLNSPCSVHDKSCLPTPNLDPAYVKGFCVAAGTCFVDEDFRCHPPSCKDPK